MIRDDIEKGFTLIETLVYIGLFVLLVGGGMATAYNIFSSNATLQSKIFAEQEGEFVLGKLNWILSSTASTSLNPSPLKLTVTRPSGTFEVTYDQTSKQVILKQDSGSPKPLNSTASRVEAFTISKTETPGLPDQVNIAFNIESRTFSLNKYVRE